MNKLQTPVSITLETIDKLISAADRNQHPYGKAWPRFDCDTFHDLCTNIQARGLDQDILLYQDMILEGWHRYLACRHTDTEPRFVAFEGTDLQAAERVRASGVRRQSSADQRYAAFLMLGNACPEFQAKYEKLSQQGIEQKNAGTPLSTDGQRVDVLGAKAAAAGVSRATAAKVEKVNLSNPKVVSEIAKGKTTANKEVKKLNEKETPKAKFATPKSKVVFHVNTVTLVGPIREIFEDCRIEVTTSQTAKGKAFVCDASTSQQQEILNSLKNLLQANRVDLRIILD